VAHGSIYFGICFFLFSLLFAPPTWAQTGAARKIPIKIIYSALTASNAPVWVAGDQGLYDKYGLDVQIVHGRGASPIQALAGGTVELGHFAGASVISANLAGSDLVFVAAQSNYVVLSM
jgi:ABC-type nitrate/sulfonate/bicarbonate transport system substrate-binding protein